MFKLPSVSLNIRSCSLFISVVLPYYSCWISTWTGQCGMDLALLTGWLFPFCFGQNSSLFGTKKWRGVVSVHLSSGHLEPSSWSLWRLEFKFMIQRLSFHGSQKMAGGFLPLTLILFFGYFFFILHQEKSSSSLNFTPKYGTLAYIIMDSMHAFMHSRSFSEPFKIHVIKITIALLSWCPFYFMHCFSIRVSLQVK